MAKLSTLRPRLGTLPPVLAVSAGRQAYNADRDKQVWRRWYKTARWQKLRMQVLIRDAFRCQWPGCGRVETDLSQLVADHRKPHRGDERLFWSEGNLWCLCKPHHDSAKQREERRAE